MVGAFRVIKRRMILGISVRSAAAPEAVIPTEQLELRDKCQAAGSIIRISVRARNRSESISIIYGLGSSRSSWRDCKPRTSNADARRTEAGHNCSRGGAHQERVNAYMKKLGIWAAIGVVLLAAAWGLLRWIGVGVWPKTSQCSKSVPCLAFGYH
jgi:hypothetical protein